MNQSTENQSVDLNPNVKVSFCQKCNHQVRVAIEPKMNKASKKEFAAEVLKYDLAVKTMPLDEYQHKHQGTRFCTCPA